MVPHSLVSVCFVLLCFQALTVLSQTSNEESDNSDETFEDEDNLSYLIGQTMNFSTLSNNTQGVQLTLLKRPVDFSNFVVDASNVKQLNKMVRGRNISEFLYVASHLAGIEARLAARRGETITTLELESLFSPESDTVFDSHEIDEFLSEITEVDSDSSSEAPIMTKRKASIVESSRWPTTIPYIISTELAYDPKASTAIAEGIKNWEDETCLSFQKVETFEGSHIIFRRKKGCWSYLGRIDGNVGQNISIGRGCESAGVVAHEIGHALGFIHEHQRPDRDEYVTINYGNIEYGESYNFERRYWSSYLTTGIPYDYSSVMHYKLNAFSRNSKNTLTVKEENAETLPGSDYVVSFYDAKLANHLYCPDRCSGGLAWSACQNDGYRDPKDCTRCKCPDGWTGTHCTEVQPAVNANCGSTELVPSSTWTTVMSPNYQSPVVRQSKVACTWRIKTNQDNTRIVMRFKDNFKLPCSKYRGACESYVEVRHKEMARTGPRYCCYEKPSHNFVSHGKEVLLLLRLGASHHSRGFKLEYRLEPCGCSSNTSLTSLPACLDTQTYSCPGTYRDCTVRGCQSSPRENTCYKEVKTCCGDFKLDGDRCYGRGHLSSWSNWSTCSKTCDSGRQTRTRACNKPPCSDALTQSQSCNQESCTPIEVSSWTSWKEWTTCSRSCGSGTQMRFRNCMNPPCSNGTWYETARCNTGSCDWTNWSLWSGCSKTCGTGYRARSRLCSRPPCRGDSSQTSSCTMKDCTVPGVWSNWNTWSTCSVTCGRGTRSRGRSCSSPPCSGSDTYTASCYQGTCPGQWTNWYSWSSCSTTCGPGSRTRRRYCLLYPCSGSNMESTACNTRVCPDRWNNWTPWTSCSVTCGTGTRTRIRTCRYYPCSGSRSESTICNTNTCPANIWSTWSSWSACSRTCGSGSRTRTRSCVKSPCSGSSKETDTCSPQSCPSSSWLSWNAWSPCSRTCGIGFQIRSRSCSNPPCSGNRYEGKMCNKACPTTWSPWSMWSSCSKTCGSGTRTRARTCYGSTCSGLSNEQQNCNTNPCWCTRREKCNDFWGRTRYCIRYYNC